MKQVLLLFLMLLGTVTSVVAQKPSVVKGRVTNTAGELLAGVTVSTKGSGQTTVTDTGGNYEITANSQGELLFSYVGYQNKEERVNNRAQINIVLLAEDKSLDQVVVVGYGTQKRKDLTGAISSVKGDILDQFPVQNVASALAGQIAGLQVTTDDGTPGADVNLTLRGGGSITQSNAPLYVIDGVPQTDGLNFLDPKDIESIDVLKDASAASIYGARAANGVILVTTKKPKMGQTTITYDNYLNSKKVSKTLNVLNPYQYAVLQYERSLDDASDLAKFTNNYGSFNQLDSLYANRQGINWQHELFGDAVFSQYHKVGVSSANKQTQLNMFYSYNDDKGVMIESGAKKSVAKIDVTHNLTDRLKVNGSINYTDQHIYGVGTGEGDNYFNQLMNILTYRPTYGLNGSDETLTELNEDPYLEDDSGNTLQNPLTNAKSQHRDTYNKILYLNAGLQYKITPNITYRGIYSYRSLVTDKEIFNDSASVSARRSSGPNGSIARTDQYNWNYSNVLSYNKNFNKVHNIDVIIGQEEQYKKYKYVLTTATGFPDDNLGLNDLSQATTVVASSVTTDERLISWFGRVNYGYKDKYLLTGSLRADGSSKFGSANKYGYFPSVALAWRVIQEKFLQNNGFISDLKLRLSIGTSGNDRIDNYQSLSLFSTGSYPLNDANNVSVASEILPNPNLKWEQTLSRNVGIDLGLFKQRIQLTADYYINKTSNLLMEAEVPAISGYSSMLINAGATQNKGIELTLVTKNIETPVFSWGSNFNIAFNKNKVIKLSNGSTYMYSSSAWRASNQQESDYLIQVGKPLGQMFGYKSEGLYQVDDFDYDESAQTYTIKDGIAYDANNVPQPGYLKLSDTNGDGTVDDSDRVVIGNANPKYIGGFSNFFKYKGFDLSVICNFSVGQDVYNANKLYLSQTYLDYRNTLAYEADRWMSIDANGNRITDPETLETLNQGKTIPVYNGSGTALHLYDQMVEDGSFLRISNISVGYTFPSIALSKIRLKNVHIYGTVNNVHVFTSYTGYDPEVNIRNDGRLTPGIDFGAYPRARSYVFGVNVSL
ncbi:MAG: TonB-dependent receptor [Niabella sp.]